MTDTPPGAGPSWSPTPPAGSSPVDGHPAAVTPAGGGVGSSRVLLLLAATGVAVLVVIAGVMVSGALGGADGGGDVASDGGPGGTGDTADVGATTAPANVGTVAPTTTTPATMPDGGDETSAGSPAAAALPAVTIPDESSPPTTIPGSEPNSIPTDIFSGEEAPQFGTLVVDLEEGGYEDFAVHLRTDQEISLLSLADDDIGTEIEVYAPDGSRQGWWTGGEPGVINGLEWYLPDEPLPATGTYVIRVVHTGGSHAPFVLGFFGNA